MPELSFLNCGPASPCNVSPLLRRAGARWQRPAGVVPRAGCGLQGGRKAAAAARPALLQILRRDAAWQHAAAALTSQLMSGSRY